LSFPSLVEQAEQVIPKTAGTERSQQQGPVTLTAAKAGEQQKRVEICSELLALAAGRGPENCWLSHKESCYTRS
jgi:hypothetical protein